GARGRDYRAEIAEGGAAFTSTRGFAPGEGMTIVLSFPKGIVHEPGRIERLSRFLHDNRGAFAGGVGFLVLLAFLWWRWTLVGRDPREGPKFPRYEAPPGVGPAGARYVHRMGFDDRCFAAALLGLGERGIVAIRQSRAAYGLERKGTAAAWLPGEKPLVDSLLPQPGTRTTIGKTYDPLVESAYRHVAQELTAHFGERLFSKNHGSLLAGSLIAALVVGAMMLLLAPVSHIVAAIAVMLVTLFLFARWLPAYSVDGRKLEDHIVGLRQYLSVAEADELRRMKAPPQTPEEFAKFLPYAVALDVEKTWADRFASTLGAAAVTAAVASYYSSDSGGLFDRGGIGGFTSS